MRGVGNIQGKNCTGANTHGACPTFLVFRMKRKAEKQGRKGQGQQAHSMQGSKSVILNTDAILSIRAEDREQKWVVYRIQGINGLFEGRTMVIKRIRNG